METPKTGYHITAADNLTGILAEGLTSAWGNYLSSTLEAAGRFIGLRAMVNPEATWVALHVNLEGLDVIPGNDHSVEFFGTDDSWMVEETIGPERILDVYEIRFGQT